MKRLLILLAGLALAGAAAAAAPANQPSGSSASWYWWLHPKLGMVKVDRATNAMIVSGRQQREQSTQAGR